MKKVLIGLICSVILFSGAAYAASSLPAKGEQTKAKVSSKQIYNFQKLPITQKINDVEVTIHTVRLTDETTDFEITIKNNTDDETITPELVHSIAGTNVQIQGKTKEMVGISQDNPDFGDSTIKPNKEKYGWLSYKALSDKKVRNMTLSFSVEGKNKQRNFSFYIDCKDLKFRTL